MPGVPHPNEDVIQQLGSRLPWRGDGDPLGPLLLGNIAFLRRVQPGPAGTVRERVFEHALQGLGVLLDS